MIKIFFIGILIFNLSADLLDDAENAYSDFIQSKSKKDLKKAIDLYGFSCESGNKSSCKKYERLSQSALHNAPSADDFSKIVNYIMKQELEKVAPSPKSLKLVRGEFETTKSFNKRVAVIKKKQKSIFKKHQKKLNKAKSRAQKKAIAAALNYVWGKPILSNLMYDADNGYFVADLKLENKKDFMKKVAIKVDLANAKKFKQSFSKLKPQAIFKFDGKSVKLKEIKVPYKKKNYIALFTDKAIYDKRVAVNIGNEFEVGNSGKFDISIAQNNVRSFDTSSLVNLHELDDMLKKSVAVKKDPKKWLFVVGIEKYDYTSNISYAKRSAQMFTKTAQKRLGVPKSNTYTLINSSATQAKIKTGLRKLLRRVEKGDTIYFYYNGHGIPIPTQKNEPYMLPSDSEPDYIADEAFFSLKSIYGKLSASKAKKVVAFVDSCFSGMTDGKAVMKGVAATKMVAKTVNFDKEKMVVFSAGKAYQYSNGYNKKGHRMFSYFVMKNIIEGETDIKKLYKTTKHDTHGASIKEYGDVRAQEPTINGNARMSL